MMEMKSTLSDDVENDLTTTYASPDESHISPGSHSVRSSSRSADIHRRHTGNNTATSSVNSHIELIVRSNSKYNKRESKTRSRRWNKAALFIILPIMSCLTGFFWMLSSLGASDSHGLRHDQKSHDNLTKTRASILSSVIAKKQQLGSEGREDRSTDARKTANEISYNPKENTLKNEIDIMNGFSTGVSNDSRINQKRKSPDTTGASVDNEFNLGQNTSPNVLVTHLSEQNKHANDTVEESSRDETSNLSVIDSMHGSYYEKEYNNISVSSKNTYQISPSHRTVYLYGWSKPIANRVFPLAQKTHEMSKNIDPDYGEIVYESLRNDHFARTIPTHGKRPTPGGFDPNFESTSLKRKAKKKDQDMGPYHRSRTEKLNLKADDITPSQLSAYFDDDRVRIITYDNDDGKDDDDKDDDKSGDENESADTKKVQTGACRAMEWEYGYFPTCNEFHTIDVSRPYDDPKDTVKPRPENSMMKISYINHGHYRDVFMIEDSPWIWPNEYTKEHLNRPNISFGVLDEDKVSERITKAYRSAVLKTFNWERKLDQEHREMVNVEAVVMERLRKSPRIMDIYGHCGFSVTAEVVPIEFEEVAVDGEGYKSRKAVERRNKNGIRPYNNFTAEEKLGFALTMAESLADLHGFSDGVIVHDDVQMCQWLRLPDGTMKLGDFNRATIMEYDVVNENYCKFYNGGAFGNYRAPEEFDEKYLDEKIDVFSFGNNIYAMLTGLWGFYDISDDQVTQEQLTDGKLPYVDPRWRERSYIERRLVELMEKCWIFNPDERVDIFFAVEFLKETVRENNKLKAHKSYS